MARFIGTKEECEKFIGPSIRNKVQSLTKSERDKGICEFCKENKQLESAHKHGKERKTLIFQVLERYDNGSFVDVEDVEKCKNEIIDLHKPLNEVFYFLCKGCHKTYDKIQKNKMYSDKQISEIVFIENFGYQKAIQITDDEELSEINRVQKRIPRWFINKKQVNSKILYAYLKLYEINKNVQLSELEKEVNLPTFRTNFESMKIIAPHNHGKIFDVKDGIVVLWDKVEKIIWDHYNRYVHTK